MSADLGLDDVFVRIEQLAKSRGLAEIDRGTSYRTPALKVGAKLLTRLKDQTTLVLHCPHEQKALLMEISPDIYFETPHYVGHPVVLIRLDAIDDEELALRLEDAWRFRAPARLLRKLPRINV